MKEIGAPTDGRAGPRMKSGMSGVIVLGPCEKGVRTRSRVGTMGPPPDEIVNSSSQTETRPYCGAEPGAGGERIREIDGVFSYAVTCGVST